MASPLTPANIFLSKLLKCILPKAGWNKSIEVFEKYNFRLSIFADFSSDNKLYIFDATRSTAIFLLKSLSAIIAPRVNISSVSLNINAAGAFPFCASCNNTPLPLQEPRDVGINTTLPESSSPQLGW